MEVPQDIAFEIFSWLPAKSICKSKPTCESFSNFSHENTFKTKQAHNLLWRDDPCFFIQPEQIMQRSEKRIELHPLPKEKQSSGVPNNVLTYLSNSACVLASSNGLVLCHTMNDDDPLQLFICNPVTKTWSFIPTPESLQKDYKYANINIMLDCSHGSSDNYFVYLFENGMEWSQPYICNVYHGKEGVWKTMESCFFPGGRNIKFDMPVFYKGAVYFISDSGCYFARSSPYYKPYIMSYNLEHGTSTMINLPREAIRGSHITCDMGIFNWGKVTSSKSSICLVKLRNNVFTIWFLKDYKSSSWQKVLNVRVKTLGLKEKDLDVRGFRVMNGDLLIFSTKEKVYSYGLDGEKFMIVEEISQHNCGSNAHFISYSDTLRSCETNIEAMPC